MNEIFCKGQLQGGGWIGKRGSGNSEASQDGSALLRRGDDAGLAPEASETWRNWVGLRCEGKSLDSILGFTSGQVDGPGNFSFPPPPTIPQFLKL